MRIIAGSARGRRLHPPTGSRVRPTADRVKEALFSTLTSRLGSFEGLTVLDLFAGSGALGIEALSRGAASALFTDSHPDSIALTRKNLVLSGFEHAGSLFEMDACKAIQRFNEEGKVFDIIFVDPPYAEKELSEQILVMLSEHVLVSRSGVIVFETENRFQLPAPACFHLTGRKMYGDTALSFYELAE